MTFANTTRSILHNLLNIIKRNKLGTIKGHDPEFLHDLRIAVRKSRSVLAHLKAELLDNRTKRYINEFAWLGQATTPVRDLDVCLSDLDDYSNNAPEKYRHSLQPFYTYLQHQRGIEQKKLIKRLQSKRFNKLIKDWHAFLIDPITIKSNQNTSHQCSNLFDQFIWKLYCQVLQQGKAIKPKSPDEDLHTLRKTCKKLRYLMEFSASLYPKRKIYHAIKELKSFQTLLGDFQDCSVQLVMLDDFFKSKRAASDTLTKGTLKATQILIKLLQKKQKSTRKHFSDAFKVFSSNTNQKEFRLLFVGTSIKRETS